MKSILLINALIAGLFFSSTALSADNSDSVDETTQVEEDKRGDRGDNKRRGGDRNNNSGNLSDRAIRVIDTDEDGQVSVEEYMAHAQQRFSDLDLDGNNFVTSEEAKEAAEIMREKQREARSSLNNRKRNSEESSDAE